MISTFHVFLKYLSTIKKKKKKRKTLAVPYDDPYLVYKLFVNDE